MTLIRDAVPVMLGGGGGLWDLKGLGILRIKSVLSLEDITVSLDEASLTTAESLGSIRVMVRFAGILKIGFSTPLVPILVLITGSGIAPILLPFNDVNEDKLRRVLQL